MDDKGILKLETIIIYSLDVYFGKQFLIAMGLFRWLSGKEST